MASKACYRSLLRTNLYSYASVLAAAAYTVFVMISLLIEQPVSIEDEHISAIALVQLCFVCAFALESLAHIAVFKREYLIGLGNVIELVLAIAAVVVILQQLTPKPLLVPVSRFISVALMLIKVFQI